MPTALPVRRHRDRRAGLVLAGGMGRRAQQLLAESGIDVVVGAPAKAPDQLVHDYLNGTLQTGENICDH